MSDEELSERGKGKKAVIKGARLALYPPGMNLYRVSRGIKRPKVEVMKRDEAEKRIEGAKLLARKAIAIEERRKNDRKDTCQVLTYHYYDNSPSAREDEAKQNEWWNKSNDKTEMYYECLREEAREIARDEEYLYLTDALVPENKILTMVDVLYETYLNEDRLINQNNKYKERT